MKPVPGMLTTMAIIASNSIGFRVIPLIRGVNQIVDVEVFLAATVMTGVFFFERFTVQLVFDFRVHFSILLLTDRF